MAEVFGVDGLLVLLILLVPVSFGLVLWAVIDAAQRPEEAFRRAGQNKTLWIILSIVGLVVLGFVGGAVALVYLTAIRPRVKEQQAIAGRYYPAAPPAPPPPGWWLASDGRWYPPEQAR